MIPEKNRPTRDKYYENPLTIAQRKFPGRTRWLSFELNVSSRRKTRKLEFTKHKIRERVIGKEGKERVGDGKERQRRENLFPPEICRGPQPSSLVPVGACTWRKYWQMEKKIAQV